VVANSVEETALVGTAVVGAAVVVANSVEEAAVVGAGGGDIVQKPPLLAQTEEEMPTLDTGVLIVVEVLELQ
jgi:hypothetical protein